MFDYKKFGKGVKFYRERQNMTQLKLSEMAQVGEEHIKKIEHGYVKPSLRVVVAICNALKVSINDCLSSDRDGDALLYQQMRIALDTLSANEKHIIDEAIKNIMKV